MEGKTLLHYKILKEIGQGGMGVVYKAQDTKLHRLVAIKALSAELVGDDKSRERFLREARAASAVNHPNICTVFEVNQAQNTLFFVMQYVKGKSLKKMISGRPLAFERAMDIALQLADALSAAHAQRVIHRDIKSSNVMVDSRGHAVILDFGLAKLLAKPEDESGEFIRRPELTKAGTPFGTANYMSPEQARGERTDERSDIFSLGIVIYEMISGRLPFRGRSSVDVMHQVIHNEPEPLGNTVPEGLRQVLNKALAKDRRSRYQSADELLADLRELVREHFSGQRALPAGGLASLRATALHTDSRLERWLARVSSWLRQRIARAQTTAGDLSPGGSQGQEPTPSEWSPGNRKAIAILPFRNLSGDPEVDFYGFSLADVIITELGQIKDLIVRPSAVVSKYAHADPDPREIGAALAVDVILSGGYLFSGPRFRMTLQLIDGGSGEILWSRKIDFDEKDIISLQDTVSRYVVEEMSVRTTSDERQRLTAGLTSDRDAYESYLKGRALIARFTGHSVSAADLDAAKEMFEQAASKDPGFAMAHSALGACYLSYILKGIGGSEYYDLAKDALDKALSIDPGLIEPRVRMVYVDLAEGAVDAARRSMDHLLRYAPNEASVHSAAAYVYRLCGHYERALHEWDTYLVLDPSGVVYASYNRARVFIYQMELERAKGEIEIGLAAEPGHPLLRAYSAITDYLSGNVQEATDALEETLAENPELHSYRLFLAFCYHTAGRREDALALVDDAVRQVAAADQDSAYWLATLYAMDGQRNQALEWLDRAIRMGNLNYSWFKLNPLWDKLQGDSAFEQSLQDVKARCFDLAGDSSEGSVAPARRDAAAEAWLEPKQ